MSQPADPADRQRRPAAAKRHKRPTLVTSVTELQATPATSPTAAENPATAGAGRTKPAGEVSTATSPAKSPAQGATSASGSSPASPAVPKARRQPGFLSALESEQQKETPKQIDAGRMRLWRALRRKNAAPERESRETARAGGSASASAGSASKSAARPAAASARPGAMKPRHFAGLFIYLIFSYALGIVLTYAMSAAHLNTTLWRFNIGSLPISISSLTVVYLMLLVAILVVLTRFDLLPRFTRPPQRTDESKNKAAATVGAGPHDDLYEEYRELRRYQRRRERRR
jgi:hypothetical protein